jgi:DNA uptake protein ComE-like DNA-binding protein
MHNREVLEKFNSTNLKTLISMLGMGPKRADIIIKYHQLRDKAFRFKHFRDKRKIPGLDVSFFSCFLMMNQVNMEEVST